MWLYYGLMAAAGSLAGGFLTYRLARKGGKEALDRRFSPRKVDKVCEIFGRWGFAAIAIPALLPPPVPMVPFLLAAGAMQYPPRKFLAALTLGRISRYMILAYLAARYGRQIIAFIAEHGHPVRGGNHFGADCRCHGRFLLLARQQEQKEIWTHGERFFGRVQSPSRAGQRSAGSRSRAARHRN